MIKYSINENIIEKVEDQNIYLLNMDDESDVLYKIEGVAVIFWEGIRQNKLRDSIDTILKNYNTSAMQVESDLELFITELKKLKIVEEQK